MLSQLDLFVACLVQCLKRALVCSLHIGSSVLSVKDHGGTANEETEQAEFVFKPVLLSRLGDLM